MESTCPLRRPTVCMDSCVIDRPARRTPFEGGCLHTSLGVPRCECERPCFVRVSSMLVPIAVSRPSPSVLRPLSLVGRVGFVVRCGWLAFNQQIDPAFDMAYAGDRLEGRGPGPPLSVPMPLLPYGVQGSRVISDMVALPRPAMLGQGRSAANDYIDIDKLPSTKTKLNPRAGKTAAWEHQLKEILAGLHLSDTIHNPSPPTPEQVAHQLATSGYIMTMPQIHTWAQYVIGQWWSNSTTLYHIVYRSITLTGPFEEADLQMIQRSFWLGDYRHGYNLFQWATSHVVATSVASQSELMDKVADMKLSSNPTYEVFAAHCSNLLMNWRNIASNDIRHPAQFYYRLLKSIPEMNDSSKLGQLRAWLSGRIADEHPSLTDAVTFVDTFVKRASTIGLPKGSGQHLNALGAKPPGGDKKECKFCTSKLCRGGEFANTPLTCVCLNDKIGIPKSATEGQRKYVTNARSYAKIHSMQHAERQRFERRFESSG